MKCVYFLQSISSPSQRYIGVTADLTARLRAHNAGSSPHTAPNIPWKLVTAIYLDTVEKADTLERYLKHGLGHAFAERHNW